MPQDPKQATPDTSKNAPTAEPQPDELSDETLDKVSGGARRRTGDEDLEDLEVER